MFQPSTGLFSSLFSPRSGNKRSGRKAKAERPRRFDRIAAVEELEARRLLVSRVFLDFGNGFQVQSPTDASYPGLQVLKGVQPTDLRDALVGQGNPAHNILQETFGIIAPVGTVTPSYDIVSLGSTLNALNPTSSPIDALTLELAITAQVQQALEPFDIQVVSSALPNYFSEPGNPPPLTLASLLEARNNLPSDFGSPVTGRASVPQYGSDDVYVFLGGIFQVPSGGTIPVGSNVPISAEFAVDAGPTPGVHPDRLDTGAVIDVNYWINRVLGAGGTGGDLNVAISNATLYAVGFGYGLSETENGIQGPSTNFFDPNVALINQSNVMQEGGFAENNLLASPFDTPINDTNAAYFQRFNMMQDGADMHPFLQDATLFNPTYLTTQPFPLPTLPTTQNPLFGVFLTSHGFNGGVGSSEFFYVPPDATINSDPTVTVNSYDQLANDPDIGANPDVAYVTGTGAFDQITISKISPTQAHVTVNAYTDDTYTTLATDELGVIASYSYNINLTKLVIPGRKDDGQPFRIVIQGCSSDDQIFIDPTLGVNVEVHGGPDVKFVQLTGNGVFNVQYTPAAPPAFINSFQTVGALIYEGLTPGGAGTMAITGSTSTTVGKKTTTTPFTTSISFDHLNPLNDSAVRVDNFNQLTYKSPGFLDNEFTITSPDAGLWSIGGQVDSPFFSPALTGALQMTNVKHLDINTTLGASNDTITFATGGALPTGLQSVSVETGTGVDAVNIDDSAASTAMNYSIGPSLLQYIPVVGPLFQGFTGITYSGVESVSVIGTPGDNTYVVSPSVTTTFDIDDSDPGDNDTLAVRLNGTTGATPAAPGSGTITFGSDATHPLHQPINYTNIENFQPPPDAATPTNAIMAVGAGPGGTSKPLVKIYSATTHDLMFQFYAFEPTFKGGVQVTTADMNGDGTPDIIVAPNAGRAGEVEVFDGAVLAGLSVNPLVPITNITAIGARIADFFPDTAGAGYKNGLYIAVGDLDNDGDVDIVTSRARGVPLVRTWLNNSTGTSFSLGLSFNPYTTKFATGAEVAAADVDGDGRADIITAPGAGQIATVKIFDPQTQILINQFNGFETTFKGGVSIAAGDIDADGKAEIVLGAGTGGKSRVRVFNADQGILLKEFQAYTTGNINAPVRVALHDTVFGDNPGTGIHAMSIYTGQQLPGPTHDIRVFEPLSGVQVDHFLENAIDMRGGVVVG